MEGLQQLVELNLDKNTISSVDATSFQSLVSLRVLHMKYVFFVFE